MITFKKTAMVLMIPLTSFLLVSCTSKSLNGTSKSKNGEILFEKVIDFSAKQTDYRLTETQGTDQLLNPKSILPNGTTQFVNPTEWTSGFFPGQLWYLYELTNDTKWKEWAKRYTESIENAKYCTRHHDIGFIIGCSYGNGLRLINEESYKDVIVQAAKSLITRYRPNAKVLQSWNENERWIIEMKKGWKCPVIIDNVMNLEILFEATRFSGDSTYANIALNHANTTLKNHFRADNSCYHVLDYDPETGEVRKKVTAQGYADESIWSRGQAWAVYGFTLMYRYTKDTIYLEQATKTATMMLNHPNMAKDLVPYWDMEAPDIKSQYRDVSSACILASAFYELSMYVDESYRKIADKMIENLSKPPYLAEIGTNNYFLLKHSVGSLPLGVEIDVPLVYADYYFLEALARRQNLKNKGSIY
jgi:rhamnogalacturonyl hydrolase YesR